MHGSDPKPTSQRLMKLNPESAPKRFFSTVKEALTFFEESRTSGRLPEHVDLLCMGFPCEPFSKNRAGRFDTKPWQSHRDTYVMLDAIAVIAHERPDMIILENVRGFTMAAPGQEENTPLKYLSNALDEVSGGALAHKDLYLNHNDWMCNDRDRYSGHMFHSTFQSTHNRFDPNTEHQK